MAIRYGEPGSEPAELAPYHRATTREKTRRIHVALVETRRLYKSKFGGLIQCLQNSGETPETWHARMLLGALLPPYVPFIWFATHPSIRRTEIYALLDRAISQTRQMRGGWLVSLPGGRAP